MVQQHEDFLRSCLGQGKVQFEHQEIQQASAVTARAPFQRADGCRKNGVMSEKWGQVLHYDIPSRHQSSHFDITIQLVCPSPLPQHRGWCISYNARP